MLTCDLKLGKYVRQVGGKIPSKQEQFDLKCEENETLMAKSKCPKVLWIVLKESGHKARVIPIVGPCRPYFRLAFQC